MNVKIEPGSNEDQQEVSLEQSVTKRDVELVSILSVFFMGLTAFFFYYAGSHILNPISKDPMQGVRFGMMLIPFGIWAFECWRAVTRLSDRDFFVTLVLGFVVAFLVIYVPSMIYHAFWGSGFLHLVAIFNVAAFSLLIIVLALFREIGKQRVRSGEDPDVVRQEQAELLEDSLMARNMSWLHHYQLQRQLAKQRREQR